MAISEFHASHMRRVRVSFCVSAPDLEPSEVTLAVGLEPSASARRGDERRNRAGTILAPQAEGFWAYSSDPLTSSKDINDHFAAVLTPLLPHADKLLRFATGGGTFFDVLWESTYLYAGTGPLIDAEYLRGVARLQAGMGFDIYQIEPENGG